MLWPLAVILVGSSSQLATPVVEIYPGFGESGGIFDHGDRVEFTIDYIVPATFGDRFPRITVADMKVVDKAGVQVPLTRNGQKEGAIYSHEETNRRRLPFRRVPTNSNSITAVIRLNTVFDLTEMNEYRIIITPKEAKQGDGIQIKCPIREIDFLIAPPVGTSSWYRHNVISSFQREQSRKRLLNPIFQGNPESVRSKWVSKPQ